MSQSQLAEVRTPQVIATEINTIKGQTRDVILRSSVEIGQRLAEVKEQIPHGDWMTWLGENVDYSQSTANNLMAIYREYGSKITTLGNLSYTKALALLGVPADEREQFAHEHDAEHVSARELQTMVKAKHAIEKQLEETQKIADAHYNSYRAEADLVTYLKMQIAKAKLSGEDDEARRLQEELTASQARVQALEQELKNKPIDVGAVVEKIPEEIELELAELRKKAAQPNSQPAIRFSFCFDAVVRGFQDLLGALDSVKEADLEAYEKYKKAVSGLIGKMSERL